MFNSIKIPTNLTINSH